MSKVSFALNLSTQHVEVELKTNFVIKGNKTCKAISKALIQKGLWRGPFSGLKGKIRARTSEKGSEASIESFDVTAADSNKQGGSFLMNVTDLTGASFQSLNGQISELHARLAAVEANLVEGNVRLTVVEAEGAEFRKVALRYVIDEVHKKIQSSLGAKADNQSWDDYLGNKFNSQSAWFLKHNLGFTELALLCKGPNTHYEAGNNAAHRPQAAMVDHVVEMGGESWRRLWNLACS